MNITMEPHNRLISARHERAIKELNIEMDRKKSAPNRRVVIALVLILITYILTQLYGL